MLPLSNLQNENDSLVRIILIIEFSNRQLVSSEPILKSSNFPGANRYVDIFLRFCLSCEVWKVFQQHLKN